MSSFIEEHRERFGVEPICRALEVSASAYYERAKGKRSVDTFKTELIADRSWRSRTQLELAVVEYIAWFNNDRLHESLGDVSPMKFEDLYVPQGSN